MASTAVNPGQRNSATSHDACLWRTKGHTKRGVLKIATSPASCGVYFLSCSFRSCLALFLIDRHRWPGRPGGLWPGVRFAPAIVDYEGTADIAGSCNIIKLRHLGSEPAVLYACRSGSQLAILSESLKRAHQTLATGDIDGKSDNSERKEYQNRSVASTWCAFAEHYRQVSTLKQPLPAWEYPVGNLAGAKEGQAFGGMRSRWALESC